jgi:hypothetical protein
VQRAATDGVVRSALHGHDAIASRHPAHLETPAQNASFYLKFFPVCVPSLSWEKDTIVPNVKMASKKACVFRTGS